MSGIRTRESPVSGGATVLILLFPISPDCSIKKMMIIIITNK